MNSEWTITDELTAVGVAVAALGVLATLFTPQFQKWWRNRRERLPLVTLGDLSGAMPIDLPVRPGVVKADRTTLEAIQRALPSNTIEWIHTQDFGNGFWWKTIKDVENFNYRHTGPEHEFLDAELEHLRNRLRKAIDNFMNLASWYTASDDPGGEHDYRKIPDQYDEDGKYSDALFFKKSGEINNAADTLWEAYTTLVRRARLRLAIGDREDA